MNRRFTANGYTILEVMIVLATTGGLFLATSLLLAGKQAVTELNQSVRDFESHLQTMSGDVSNGFYPSIACNASASGPNLPGGAFTPGSNTGCIFLGKVLNVRPTSADIIPLVGLQYKSGTVSDDVVLLTDAKPKKVANQSTMYSYQFGLRVNKIVALDSGAQYQAIAFISELGGGSSVSNNPMTGSRGTYLYGILGSAFGNTSTPLTFDVSATLPVSLGNLVQLPKGVAICLDGANGQQAEITVGASGDQTRTNALVDNGVGSECN